MDNKPNNKKILYILLIFLLALLLVFVVFILQSKYNLFCTNTGNINSNEKTVENYKDIAIGKVIKFYSVEKGFKDTTDGKTYTKLKVSMSSNDTVDMNMNLYLFQLVDSAGEALSWCKGAANAANNLKSDMLPAILPAGGTIDGYLYCEGDYANAVATKVTYAVGSYVRDDGFWGLDLKYFDIKFEDFNPNQ